MKVAQRQSGFTLIETVVVLTIILIVTGLAAPALSPSFSSSNLRQSANNLIIALREARLSAVSTGRKVRVLVQKNGIQWDTNILPKNSLPAVSFELTTTVGKNDGSIIFFPHGGSSGGRITLMLHGRKRTVAVEWLTGRVREV